MARSLSSILEGLYIQGFNSAFNVQTHHCDQTLRSGATSGDAEVNRPFTTSC
jgi:hypothetical protein